MEKNQVEARSLRSRIFDPKNDLIFLALFFGILLPLLGYLAEKFN